MKKFVTIFLAAALSLGLAVGASADFEGAIKKGTPTVDGVLDAIYTDSFNLQDLGTGKNNYEGTVDHCVWPYTAQLDVYFLYDDSKLYICSVVEDDDVLTKGLDYINNDNNPWMNDTVEIRLSLDGTYDTIKVGIDAYGYLCYGLPKHYERIDYSTIKYATTRTDTSYVIEFSIPCTKGELDMIKAGKLGFTYQLTDINENGECFWFTSSFEGEAPKVPVFVALSNEEAKADAAVEDTTAAVEDTTAAVTTAPSTFDPAIIAVALTAASGAAFVLASKKH